MLNAKKFIKKFKKKITDTNGTHSIEEQVQAFRFSIANLKDGDLKNEITKNLKKYEKILKRSLIDNVKVLKNDIEIEPKFNLYKSSIGDILSKTSNDKDRISTSYLTGICLKELKHDELSSYMDKLSSQTADIPVLERVHQMLLSDRSELKSIMSYLFEETSNMLTIFGDRLKEGSDQLLHCLFSFKFRYENYNMNMNFKSPKYEDLMAALLATYVDMVIIVSRKNPEQFEKLKKHLTFHVSYILSCYPSYICDVLISACEMKSEDLRLVETLFKKALLNRPTNELNEYIKYVMTGKKFYDLSDGSWNKQIKKFVLAVPAPVDFLKDVSQDVLDFLPVTRDFLGVHITKFIINEGDNELAEKLMDIITTDDGDVKENVGSEVAVTGEDSVMMPDNFMIDVKGDTLNGIDNFMIDVKGDPAKIINEKAKEFENEAEVSDDESVKYFDVEEIEDDYDEIVEEEIEIESDEAAVISSEDDGEDSATEAEGLKKAESLTSPKEVKGQDVLECIKMLRAVVDKEDHISKTRLSSLDFFDTDSQSPKKTGSNQGSSKKKVIDKRESPRKQSPLKADVSMKSPRQRSKSPSKSPTKKIESPRKASPRKAESPLKLSPKKVDSVMSPKEKITPRRRSMSETLTVNMSPRRRTASENVSTTTRRLRTNSDSISSLSNGDASNNEKYSPPIKSRKSYRGDSFCDDSNDDPTSPRKTRAQSECSLASPRKREVSKSPEKCPKKLTTPKRTPRPQLKASLKSYVPEVVPDSQESDNETDRGVPDMSKHLDIAELRKATLLRETRRSSVALIKTPVKTLPPPRVRTPRSAKKEIRADEDVAMNTPKSKKKLGIDSPSKSKTPRSTKKGSASLIEGQEEGCDEMFETPKSLKRGTPETKTPKSGKKLAKVLGTDVVDSGPSTPKKVRMDSPAKGRTPKSTKKSSSTAPSDKIEDKNDETPTLPSKDTTRTPKSKLKSNIRLTPKRDWKDTAASSDKEEPANPMRSPVYTRSRDSHITDYYSPAGKVRKSVSPDLKAAKKDAKKSRRSIAVTNPSSKDHDFTSIKPLEMGKYALRERTSSMSSVTEGQRETLGDAGLFKGSPQRAVTYSKKGRTPAKKI